MQSRDESKVLVGRTVTVRALGDDRAYFTDAHRAWIGRSGRIHAVVPGDRDNPLIKVGFEEGTKIVFYRLADLDVDRDAQLEAPRKHGSRGSHLPN
jgi:hypothetical protein